MPPISGEAEDRPVQNRVFQQAAKKIYLMKKVLLLLLSTFFCCQAAYAIDPGKVQGMLMINKEPVDLKEAYAHYHDNAEGLLDRPKEIRIVLTDRQIPQESLRGIAFLPVTALAKEGQVKGLLLQFDPGDRSKMIVTLLNRPARLGSSLMTLSLIDTEQPLLKRLIITKTRVEGEVEYAEKRQTEGEDLPNLSYSVKFSAPLFYELPVTADLKGRQAQDSPQIKVLREKISALKKGDFETVKKVSSDKANQRNAAFMEQMGDNAKVFGKEAAADLEKSLKTLKRIVVRGGGAIAICSDKTWFTFVMEGSKWKSDD
jgi:hypothetical protein